MAYASVGTDPSGATPTPENVFRAGSITKLFTALTVLSLVDDGLVDLDAPLSLYVERVGAYEGVLVRHALEHRSGIPDPADDPDFGFLDVLLKDPSREWAPEEIMAFVPAGALDFKPGSAYAYSNPDYTMLGLLIEEVTGLPYHEALRSRLLDPLELTNTYVAEFEDGPAVFGGYYELGLNQILPLTFDYTSIATASWSSGAIVSNGQDLHTLLSALFAGEIISPDLLTQMTANPEHGFGIYVPGLTSETPIFGHDGRTPGSGTWVVHAPETGMTVFTVSNARHLRVTPATVDVAEAIAVPGVQLVPNN
ncbi:MAG: beta-lactamase family protein [Actinomycetia bacterium]|nr:beta-lactamase family protein [Actinomycetes bacterium]